MVTDSNNPINVLIVDDENKACSNLSNLLLNYVDPWLNIVGFAHDPIEAEQQLIKLKPDVVFLDIHMPHGNVFEMLDRLSPLTFEVIFVTAFDDYAVKAFRLSALDYILKPISLPELKNAVHKLKERLTYKKIVAAKETTFSDINNHIKNRQLQPNITFRGQNSVEIVNFKDIYFIEAHSSYCRILFNKDHHAKEMIMSSPLLEYEELLPPDLFFRIHKSYLVNCLHIVRIDSKDNHNLILTNKTELPISRRRFSQLLEFLRTNNFRYE